MVAPFTGAWIEMRAAACRRRPWSLSPPSRERGLKFLEAGQRVGDGVSLPSRERGLKSVRRAPSPWTWRVAPFTGAWIEIDSGRDKSAVEQQSLPSRERGLKLDAACGRPAYDMSLPSRERGLK